MFPTMYLLQLKYLLELVKGDTNAVCDLLLPGVNYAESFSFLKKSKSSSQVLESYNPICAAEELLALYKSKN